MSGGGLRGVGPRYQKIHYTPLAAEKVGANPGRGAQRIIPLAGEVLKVQSLG